MFLLLALLTLLLHKEKRMTHPTLLQLQEYITLSQNENATNQMVFCRDSIFVLYIFIYIFMI